MAVESNFEEIDIFLRYHHIRVQRVKKINDYQNIYASMNRSSLNLDWYMNLL